MIDTDANSMYPHTFHMPMEKWHWDYHPTHHRWETYRLPIDWPFGLYQWLWDTFGHPGTDRDSGNQCKHSGWDYRGGWIYIYREDYLMLFKLRWA